MIKTDEAYIRQVLERRDRDAHKGDFGKVLVFAGSAGMAGAAILCGSGALRSGAGLVRYLLTSYTSPIYPVLQVATPEATCRVYGKDTDFGEYTAIAAGPGLGKDDTTKAILVDLIDNYDKTLVLDADALNIISENEDIAEKVKNSKATIIMTPHIGEARRLLGVKDPIKTTEERVDALQRISRMYNCLVVLKGAETLIGNANESDELYMNTNGNPGMATGGSGDVLTGIIVALAAQGYSPLDSARLGAFIHGKAGDLAAVDYGEMSMLSSNITAYIPTVLKLYYPVE